LSTTQAAADASVSRADGFFGHPRGLSTLFFTEMWERFSYYGMRALLTLFMTTATAGANPGLGFDVATAGAVYGLYTSLVYVLALPGGWIADNLWGQRKAIWVGGWIIAAGHFTMAVPGTFFFFLGLFFVICGTGLLKPNVSSVVGELYPEGGARRDAGFSIFYMGINLGALLGPAVTGWLGEGHRWHWGFGAAGVGMVLGLIQYRVGLGHLGEAGALKSMLPPDVRTRMARRFFAGFFGVVAAAVGFGLLVWRGILPFGLTAIASALGYAVLVLVALYFVYVWTLGGHTPDENKRMAVIFWLFLLVAVFWSGFEQAGTSLNLFARDLTDRVVLGRELPASWLQSVNPLFIILLAPVVGSLWVRLERRGADPSIPAKAGLGLLSLAAGFLVLAWGAANATPDRPVSPSWLVVTYFFHTVGELAISPIGLSAVTKLSPARRVGQMMGIWFVGTALGNLFAGLVAGRLDTLMPTALFRAVAVITGVVGVVGLISSPWVQRLAAPRAKRS
jgi:POT family proton-dependent oligopeptide transporter